MASKVFINFPSNDLGKARTFFEGLGFSINPKFTDDNGMCVVVSDDIYFMVLTRPFFEGFVNKKVGDNRLATQSIYSLAYDLRSEVDMVYERAISLGATAVGEAKDYGFMYQRAFEDLDGNNFEIFWMDPKAAEMGPEEFMKANGDAA
ncbi:MAG: glyoxalase [Microbacteriaceae bacterium]